MPPARPNFRRLALPAGGLAAALAVAGSGCYYSDQGLPPPTNGFYFPTGLVVSPGRTALYVANSDFDLQYNGGTVQVLDLAGLRESLGNMLAGIRCSENTGFCVTAGFPATGIALSDVCNSIPVSRSGGKSGDPSATCSAASDCASGFCSASGTCQACGADTDCPGSTDPAHCDKPSGVCMLGANNNQILTPSACTPLAPPFGAVGTVGAFASGAVIARDPSSTATRLFVPVRGDPSITWFDLPDDSASAAVTGCTALGAACTGDASCCTGSCTGGACGFKLACGQSSVDQRCDDAHRIGVDPYDNFRDLTLPVEPIGLDVSTDGADIVSAHQIQGAPAVGLSLNPWGASPTFSYYLSGNSVAPGPSDVVHVPEPKIVAATSKSAAPVDYQRSFLVSYNATAEIDVFRVNPDQYSSPPRPFVQRSFVTGITVNADGRDSRGMAVDGSERAACEAACDATAPAATYRACLRDCLNTPLRLFMANRSPPSLLLGRVRTAVVDSDVPPVTDCRPVGGLCAAPIDCCTGICQAGFCSGPTGGPGAYDYVEIYGQTSLAVGPSKVALGKALGPDGKTLKTYVFAVTFDSRFVFMYDPDAQQVVQVIRTGRGPHAIAFDSCTTACGPRGPYAYLYIGHFTDSYLGVVDLDMSHPETFGTMFASVGAPLPPLESK